MLDKPFYILTSKLIISIYKNQRKNKKPKILMKSKGLLLNNNQHFKTTFKNVFGFKTVSLRKNF